MTTAAGTARKRRPNRQDWATTAVLFVTIGGIVFGLELLSGDSVRPSLAFAASIALTTIAYQFGYRAGRRDYETPHPTTFVPPPKQR